MLVLTRKVGEEIVIGDGVVVSIVEILGSKVRLGIIAPKDVLVDRSEIRKRRLESVLQPRQVKKSLDIQSLFCDKPLLIALTASESH